MNDARSRHLAEFMASYYPAFSRRATQVCVMSKALDSIAKGAPDAPAIAAAALREADPFGWTTRACSCPSGDGSLRWPCLVHPPAAVAHHPV